ncbi:C2 domain-containing protein [Lactarius sanguifluus]|nr:C2 domain-containing protein [Lactarius sanguifluus]
MSDNSMSTLQLGSIKLPELGPQHPPALLYGGGGQSYESISSYASEMSYLRVPNLPSPSSGAGTDNILLSPEMVYPNTAPKPSSTGRLGLRIPILRRGTNRDSSSHNPGETPVVLLRVRVISCCDLEAKGLNGYSDPFVTVSLSDKRSQTTVCKRNLNPQYGAKDATFDFPIYESLVHELGTLKFVVWDKDIIRNNYLGEYSLPVNQWINGTAFGFDDRNNKPFSVDLFSSSPTTNVRGTMRIKVGFVHLPDSTRQPDFRNTYNTLIANNNHLKVGVVTVDICHAKGLPEWPNMTYMGWDMDPFVEVSIGEQVRRTRVIQHTRDPVWNEQLSFHVRQRDLSLPIRLTVFDRYKFTADDYVGEAEINITSLVEKVTTKDSNVPLYPDRLQTMLEFDLPLSTNPKRAYTCIPIITVRANYRPYFVPGQRARQGR